MSDMAESRARETAPTWDNRTPDKGRADGCANTNIGPGRSTKESDVKASVPPAAHETQQPPETFDAAMSRVDGCPACVYNTEAPFRAYPVIGGWVASYRCGDCGHRWTTGWRD